MLLSLLLLFLLFVGNTNGSDLFTDLKPCLEKYFKYDEKLVSLSARGIPLRSGGFIPELGKSGWDSIPESMMEVEPFVEFIRSNKVCFGTRFHSPQTRTVGSFPAVGSEIAGDFMSMLASFDNYHVQRYVLSQYHDKVGKELDEMIHNVNATAHGYRFTTMAVGQSYLNHVQNTRQRCMKFAPTFLQALRDLPVKFELDQYRNFADRFGYGVLDSFQFGYRSLTIGYDAEKTPIATLGTDKISEEECSAPAPMFIRYRRWSSALAHLERQVTNYRQLGQPERAKLNLLSQNLLELVKRDDVTTLLQQKLIEKLA